MQESWKPTAAGVLAIIGGTLKMLAALVAWLYLARFRSLDIPPSLATVIIAVLLAVGVVAITGGSFAVRRSHWGLALAGAICAIVPPFFTLGILSTVWVTISRREFH
jgi:hypothetical protein